MFVDKDLVILNNSAIPTASGIVGKVVDLKAHGMLAGEPVYLMIHFTTAFTGTNTPKVTFSVQTSTEEVFTDAAKINTLVVSPEITPDDDIGKGLKPLIIPINVPFAEQYLRIYETASGTISTGSATVMLLLDAQTAGLQKQTTDI